MPQGSKKGLPGEDESPITSSRGDGNRKVSVFTNVDWAVVAGYLLLTTLVGHLLRGKQASVKDFFLGGRSLPWPAVSGSIIATEISGVTFIGVPGMVYAAQGDFTYLP